MPALFHSEGCAFWGDHNYESKLAVAVGNVGGPRESRPGALKPGMTYRCFFSAMITFESFWIHTPRACSASLGVDKGYDLISACSDKNEGPLSRLVILVYIGRRHSLC